MQTWHTVNEKSSRSTLTTFYLRYGENGPLIFASFSEEKAHYMCSYLNDNKINMDHLGSGAILYDASLSYHRYLDLLKKL